MAAQQQPAVVVIARHGPRLDAADKTWHLSTPAPYDPPLTYGGWKQSKALGIRIASLLHAREASGVQHDDENFAKTSEHGGGPPGDSSHVAERRKTTRRHKVVIHSSPFLRCVQTSIAISAGLAQFQPSTSGAGSSKGKTPNQLHSAPPKLRAMEGAISPSLPPITEPGLGEDLARDVARRTLAQRKPHQRAKLRVDAFLGEWLSPDYFENITPPPPSPLMLATAKSELLQQEPIDVYTPSLSTKSSAGSLWSARNGHGHDQSSSSEQTSLDSLSSLTSALPKGGGDHPSSHSSAGSAGSNGRKSPRRLSTTGYLNHNAQFSHPRKQELPTVYIPPTPTYAVSPGEPIPRGYVAHARDACADLDLAWDSMKEPQNWGDGGDYGEEWSAMHRRLRRGVNSMVQWYSERGADDMLEQPLALPETTDERVDDDVDLVVILVTHGAGSNALIGALTNQPVLLDVPMASLSMAVRKPDAPPLPKSDASSLVPFPSPGHNEGTPWPSRSPSVVSNGHRRRGSLDLGLSSIYEMKLVASGEHLRPGIDLSKIPIPFAPALATAAIPRDRIPKHRQRFGSGSHAVGSASPLDSPWGLSSTPTTRTNTLPTSLGSMRRPSAAIFHAPPQAPTFQPAAPASVLSPLMWGRPALQLTSTEPTLAPKVESETLFGAGLWAKRDRGSLLSPLHADGPASPGHDMVLDFSTSPPDTRPSTSEGADDTCQKAKSSNGVAGNCDGTSDQRSGDTAADTAALGSSVPEALSGALSQKGLWGSRPNGDVVERSSRGTPKRRWTVQQE